MQKKLHIKKGDTVIVISGESRGQKGRVLEVNREKNRALVEGVNLVSKHTKPNAKAPQGGILRKKLRFISQTLCWLIRLPVIRHALEGSSTIRAN
jgi:ribosomal protein L24